MDYYQILGVGKNADEAEIKRAYRKAAHKHHPDKGSGDEEKFKQVNEAYQVLSDPQKRAAYDRFGAAGVRGAAGGGANGYEQGGFGGFEDMFSGSGFKVNFGGGGIGDIFEEMFSGAFATVQAEIHVELSTALLGSKIDFSSPLGDKLTLSIPPCTQDGTQFRFKGRGQSTRSGKRGDLIIILRIKWPKRLSREQRDLLEQLREKGI